MPEPLSIRPESGDAASAASWHLARQREQGADRRFVTGLLVFLAVALAYPWYAFFVESWLTERMLAKAALDAQQMMVEQGRQVQAAQRESARERRAESRAQRIAAVQVAGVSDNGGEPVVIVRLGSASLDESRARICAQAADWLRRPVAGTRLRIQRHNGDRPATDAGTLSC